MKPGRKTYTLSMNKPVFIKFYETTRVVAEVEETTVEI
jgi:hypothetical protein